MITLQSKKDSAMVEGLNKRTLNKLYIKEKKSLREIAKIFDCSRTTIQKKCRQYGLKLRPSGRRIMEDLNKSILQKLYIKEGKSVSKIAEHFSCSPVTIRKRCMEYGIVIRKPKWIRKSAKVLRALYFDKGQLERLNSLSAKTKVPKTVLIKEGVDLVLGKYRNELKGKHQKRERRYQKRDLFPNRLPLSIEKFS